MSKLAVVSIFFICCIVQTANVYAQKDEALKIVPNGNVGIGVSDPKEKLEVDGRIKDKTGWVMPVGSIIAFAGDRAPEGWLLCDGSSYDTTGSELFQIIGFTYGITNNQFHVPDLRQTFVMGAGAGEVDSILVGNTGEPVQHRHSVNIPEDQGFTSNSGSHSHKFPSAWKMYSLPIITPGGYQVKEPYYLDPGTKVIQEVNTQDSGDHSHLVTIPGSTQSTSISYGPNRPKWAALNYIIKY